MLDRAISLLAPHPCISCNRIGALVCARCHDELCENRRQICISCGKVDDKGLCEGCSPGWPVERALLFSEREGTVKTLIDELKYGNKRAAHEDLARLAATLLPYGAPLTLVPLPTIPRHVRQRGYDHTALITKRAATLQRLTYSPKLTRYGTAVQHGASKAERVAQAAEAFAVRGPVDPTRTYVVLDDITTTGASLRAAAQTLRDAGAPHVWVLALARQPLG